MTPDTSASVAASLPGPAPGEVIGEAPGPGGPPIGLPGNDGLPGSGPPGVIGGVGGSGGGTMYSAFAAIFKPSRRCAQFTHGKRRGGCAAALAVAYESFYLAPTAALMPTLAGHVKLLLPFRRQVSAGQRGSARRSRAQLGCALAMH